MYCLHKSDSIILSLNQLLRLRFFLVEGRYPMNHKRYVWIGLFILIATLSLFFVNNTSKEELLPMEKAEREDTLENAEPDVTSLFDFAESSAWTYWNIVNDGVMGGVSQSRMVQTDQRTALFSGVVSLENNGGFASIQARFAPVDPSSYDGIEVTYKGDNQRYGFNMRDRLGRTVYQMDYVSLACFQTTMKETLAIHLFLLQSLHRAIL
jgi:hypothetical protein